MPKKSNRNAFRGYAAYVAGLRRLAMEPSDIHDWSVRVDDALNGQASAELRRVAPLLIRRKFGAFFTGTDLSARLIKRCIESYPTSVFYDPACGIGDLLVAAARALPLCKKLPETLQRWGKQLSGTDVHSEFVEGARTRLVLLARLRHNSDERLQKSIAGYFPNIRVADGLVQRRLFSRATHVLLNPPFGKAVAPAGCKWGTGRITEAATFIIEALERSKPGTEMLAILPEVLRSGSSKERWRNRVSQLAEVKRIEPYGIFDASADVHVFLLRLLRRETESLTDPKPWMRSKLKSNATVGSFFHVRVGRVVPHRDPKKGKWHPYIHPRIVPVWEEMVTFPQHRRHAGLAHPSPFVAIRRTSRPGDRFRATGTVVLCAKPVAVENHFIVCEPRDGSADTCRALMRRLQTQQVNEFLDMRIRCRHLTVGAVAAIPFKPQ
jgi:N-6 DNA Methylase